MTFNFQLYETYSRFPKHATYFHITIFFPNSKFFNTKNPNPVLSPNFLPPSYIHTLMYKLIFLFGGMYSTMPQSPNSV